MSESVSMRFDPDAWTLGDMDTFEEMTGLTLQEAFTPASMKDSGAQVTKDSRGRPVKAIKMTSKVMLAIVLIERRHDDPSFTLEDARATPVGSLELVGGDADPKDKPAASND